MYITEVAMPVGQGDLLGRCFIRIQLFADDVVPVLKLIIGGSQEKERAYMIGIAVVEDEFVEKSLIASQCF